MGIYIRGYIIRFVGSRLRTSLETSARIDVPRHTMREATNVSA